MAARQADLFSWTDIEASSDLDRFALARDHLPDQRIIQYLEAMRGNGRDEYPVTAMWNALIAGIVFQHPSIASLIRELSRNPALLQACGFSILPIHKRPMAEIVPNPHGGQPQVTWLRTCGPRYSIPSNASFSRFLSNLIELEECLGLVSDMIPQLREQLMAELPDFGQHLGYDGKAIQSHSTGYKNKSSGETSDPDADWGHHETVGLNARTGKQWKKVKSWFGYGLHLVADTHYEIPVAMHLTPASHSEQKQLRVMIHELMQKSPELASRCNDFSADRGLDSGQTKALLWDDYSIRPLIDTRLMWRDEKKAKGYDANQPVTRALFSERVDTIVYSEKGSVHCICPETGTQRDLAFQGFESDRDSLKYRCPAAAYGLECQGQEQCHRSGHIKAGSFGRIVRINLKQSDRRIFTPTPHGSPSWKRGYNSRSALERINNRIDSHFGFEQHFIRGIAKMKTRVGLALAVMMSMALAHAKAGREDQMRSLVQAIPDTG